MSQTLFQKNRIQGNEDYIIKVAKSKGFNISYDNFKVFNDKYNEDGWSLDISANGKDYQVIVNNDGRIFRLDKNKTGCYKNKEYYHVDGNGKGVFTWIIAFDSIKTTHNPKSMGKMKNKVDVLLNKNNYIKFT